MNNFDRLNRIRNEADRTSEMITNVSEVSGESGFKCLHVLWLYPDVMNIHGGRGDILGLLHIANLLDLPIEIRRCDSLRQDIDWQWPHMVFMTAGELKCAGDVIEALQRQMGTPDEEDSLAGFIERGGFFVANGSSGAVLADSIEFTDDMSVRLEGGAELKGLGLLHMKWKQRSSVFGDDIWIKTTDGIEVIGNQIQVADVQLAEDQQPFGKVVYGRGNSGAEGYDLEGARTGNVMYTGVLGPLITKNPLFTASILKDAAELAGITIEGQLRDEDIEMELKSAEYIKNFMLGKQLK